MDVSWLFITYDPETLQEPLILGTLSTFRRTFSASHLYLTLYFGPKPKDPFIKSLPSLAFTYWLGLRKVFTRLFTGADSLYGFIHQKEYSFLHSFRVRIHHRHLLVYKPSPTLTLHPSYTPLPPPSIIIITKTFLFTTHLYPI